MTQICDILKLENMRYWSGMELAHSLAAQICRGLLIELLRVESTNQSSLRHTHLVGDWIILRVIWAGRNRNSRCAYVTWHVFAVNNKYLKLDD